MPTGTIKAAPNVHSSTPPLALPFKPAAPGWLEADIAWKAPKKRKHTECSESSIPPPGFPTAPSLTWTKSGFMHSPPSVPTEPVPLRLTRKHVAYERKSSSPDILSASNGKFGLEACTQARFAKKSTASEQKSPIFNDISTSHMKTIQKSYTTAAERTASGAHDVPPRDFTIEKSSLSSRKSLQDALLTLKNRRPHSLHLPVQRMRRRSNIQS